MEVSQHSQQQTQTHEEMMLVPSLTRTDTQGRLQLRYTLINGKLFLKDGESLIRKHKAHPVPSA